MWQSWIFGRTNDSVSEALMRLPEAYVVLNDILLPEGTAALDHIVAGPTGLFAIETNDWDGPVKCKGHDWFVGRKRVASPGRAAQRKAAALRRSLVNMTYDGEHKIPDVSAILAFVHPEVQIGVDEPAVPAMRVEELASFIMHYKVAELSDEDRATIVRHLGSFPSRPKQKSFWGLALGVGQRSFAPRPLA
ncbi:MAG TPA: nuclease-related domain-containing protein [Verrucomicrobiae bacterium]|jgi:Nuclease-related domain|nr:nuclease-related domain-containing protein [Verrucomicrobiae bacterium]